MKYKIIKWLITHSTTAMKIVIEYRNEAANYYEKMLLSVTDQLETLSTEKQMDNVSEKEEILAEFKNIINALNSDGELSYSRYSEIFDMGEKLANDEYEQGKADMLEEVISLFKEMRPRLATNVYEFGDKLEQLKVANNNRRKK